MQRSKLSKGIKFKKRFTIRDLWVVWYTYCGFLIPHVVLAYDKRTARMEFRRQEVEQERIYAIEKHSSTKKYRSCLLTKADIHRIGTIDRRGSRKGISTAAGTAAPKVAK